MVWWVSVPNFSSLARLEVPEKFLWCWVGGVGFAKSFSCQTQPLCWGKVGVLSILACYSKEILWLNHLEPSTIHHTLCFSHDLNIIRTCILFWIVTSHKGNKFWNEKTLYHLTHLHGPVILLTFLRKNLIFLESSADFLSKVRHFRLTDIK